MPNVHTHAKRARARTNGSEDEPQAIEHIAEPQATPEVVGLSEILRGGLGLTTQTSNGGSAIIRIADNIFAVTLAALAVIALAILFTGYWLVSSMTEIRVNLSTIQESQREIRAENTSNLKLMIAYATNETNRINFLTGLLTENERRQLYEYDRANPRPALPDSKDEDERNR